MSQLFESFSQLWWRKVSKVFLALFFLSGSLFGLYFYFVSGPSFSSLMRSMYCSSVSIVGLCFATVLPYLLSVFAVYFSAPALMLLIGFCKAFLTAFVSIDIHLSFGSAGWLACILFLFSDYLLMPVYYSFWHHHISGEWSLCILEIIAAVSFSLLVACIDYRFIFPLWEKLIIF